MAAVERTDLGVIREAQLCLEMIADTDRLASRLSILEQVGVRTRTDKNEGVALQPIDQQKVATDMTFAVISPITLERMVPPFGAQRRIVANEQQHGLFQTYQVVSA